MMRVFFGLLLAIFVLVLMPGATRAQEGDATPATLVADSVRLTDDRVLIAEGNIDILQGNTRLTAQRVTYDGQEDTLRIEGPLVLRDGESNVILADQAALSRSLENGILLGARLVLNQQLQIAAVELQRVDGRYSQALKVAATSCHVCDTGRPPLWQIRARRIVHDQEERQLYFDEAQLQILGVPILYVPRLRLPDPTLERATGFLIPEFFSSSLLGNGIRTPYFIALNGHSDLTIAPFLTTNTRTLEFTYRRAFTNGNIVWDTYVSRDEFGPEDTRWAVLAEGEFAIGRGYDLSFDIEASSDRSYLADYKYSGKDRLDSAIAFNRTRARDTTSFELVSIRSLRDGDDDATQPGIIFDASHALRFAPAGIGGDAKLLLDMHTHRRSSRSTVDSDGDGISDGLDVLRAGVSLDWQREWVTGVGLVFGAKALLGGDLFLLSDDDSFEDRVSRSTGAAAFSLRWPLMETDAGGATHLLEPKIQLAYTEASDATLPNEDSTRVEFDEGSLFRLNRAPGADVFETGTRLDLGLSWTRMGPKGWDSTLSVSRVERFSHENAFSSASGLDGTTSNWVISGSLETPGAYDVIGRLLLAPDLSVTKNDLRVRFTGDRFRASTGFAYLSADLEEDRPNSASELSLATAYDVSDTLTALVDMRYDFTTDTTTEASIGINYLNECVEFALSISRNFTSSASVTPSTDFAVRVGLRGFGTGATKARHAANCR